MKDELDFLEMISFSGRPEDKIKVVSLLDKALKEQGDLGVYGDLSCGVEELLKDSYISITDNEEFYGIAVSPKSGAGHDFSFDVDRKSGEISNVVVGVVVPPPGV